MAIYFSHNPIYRENALKRKFIANNIEKYNQTPILEDKKKQILEAYDQLSDEKEKILPKKYEKLEKKPKNEKAGDYSKNGRKLLKRATSESELRLESELRPTLVKVLKLESESESESGSESKSRPRSGSRRRTSSYFIGPFS